MSNNIQKTMSNDKKQTAVEWLTEKIETQREKGEVDLRTILHYCEKAKAMEEEQIINANEDVSTKDGEFLTGKQYFNETYKQNETT